MDDMAVEEDQPEWLSSAPSPPFRDAFRLFHPLRSSAFTCWNVKMGCRSTNHGTRIDYVLLDKEKAANVIESCDILAHVEGSDHCPVEATLKVKVVPPAQPAQWCSCNFSEFSSAGSQKKVSDFFARSSCKEVKNDQVVLKKRITQQTKMSEFFQHTKAKKEQKEPCIVTEAVKRQRLDQTEAWKSLFSFGQRPPPVCRGHAEPATLKTVSKKGPNKGRQFWSCSRGEGKVGDPEARCNFFQWNK